MDVWKPVVAHVSNLVMAKNLLKRSFYVIKVILRNQKKLKGFSRRP